ncbi:hypothetical protein B5723_15105 [Mammaliicoccus sciuri]|uniref:hypothetical protein n=1 Tax=Mammaliicoccus sciuri TaxID=1296 RepID=UPI000A054FFA|nr:hypothetical protein [Mammaliicoccus sciuri]ORI00201.1 hypothetical protein B5723_15105 [Mammaliicoccus sciuri]
MNRNSQYIEDSDHEGYRLLLQHKDYKEYIKKNDIDSRKHFISMAYNSKTDIFSRNFSNKIMNVFPKNDFYIHIQQFPDNDSPSYMIFNANITAFIQFRLAGRSENKYLDEMIKKYQVLMEVESLHSFEKGMGSMLVNQLKKLSDNMAMPIYLYDTNLKDEYYYQNLSFFDTNEKGNYGEPLLLYKPKKEDIEKKEKGIISFFKKIFNRL